ncbi:tRNAm(5)U-54 methyltransferase [Rubrobacter radiotolerans]|uniref:Methylenetetrahydrofolate--tRNA-(uracil-5-)-methyltransferase TrmFO n=1 Tax=Rubrobacter radiotolerans TaxID=42256 RepID=A0A023X091_RUBRA|nr:methylenetetrahydrofolate--tRNA-(uracil(54)-C(5))-methyltransferase (FADH(2)-oxidizing) TrmFO [Rubrobacter radiotolerans]AHY45758.1 tRNAm(5)U-54 methyltransferase [Rubrobacter radiotolerans]MDX5893174.1 methylenetetrahydrofolate--tRNA-(uracil(54)-C(5))-methyltransferase (FADH(2)-oxidizing) TrmFO [Rubrobacter radiotolerans]SMC03208.1 methylenetetrahydrofolate--tRNA-(uracil-5-)-methyltransferase [Rubrobacter radiotolerans DSM 5868]
MSYATADVTVIGAGLAGSEAAWQAAEAGLSVRLFEMRPVRKTPAHRTHDFAELVCSNSLGGRALETASGLLKEELRRMGSVILRCAERTAVPAGGALGVGREEFPRLVTETVSAHPRVEVVREEVTELPDGPTVVATGPLTSEALHRRVEELSGENLYFYDAASPIIHRDSIDGSVAYLASRWGKGEASYINCPMDREEYYAFVEELRSAELSPIKDFEEDLYFEGCLPVETIARRGVDTLRFGPMRPVGLPDPRTGREPFAVVQLRQDDAEGRLFNIVGFQTRLKWGEQRRVFRTIPGLQNADFARMGVMHRNTYVPANRMLDATMKVRDSVTTAPLFFAGQLTGVEGYVESTAMGLLAGTNAARTARGESPVTLPKETMTGALADYITTKEGTLQPINSNWGLVPSVPKKENGRRVPKAERRLRQAEAALRVLDAFLDGEKVRAAV